MIFNNKQERLDKEFVKQVTANNIDSVKSLLDSGANVNINKCYALKICVMNDFLEMFICLVNAGANTAFENHPLLEQSCHFGSLNIVKHLVNNGADVSANNNQSIKNALLSTSNKIVKYFVIECGVDIDVVINSENPSIESKQWAMEYKATMLKDRLEKALEKTSLEINLKKLKV